MSFQKSFFISYASHEEKPSKDPRGCREQLVEYEENWLCTSGLHIVVHCASVICNVIHEIFSARWEISISLFIAK